MCHFTTSWNCNQNFHIRHPNDILMNSVVSWMKVVNYGQLLAVETMRTALRRPKLVRSALNMNTYTKYH
jgi:hypothetical protein